MKIGIVGATGATGCGVARFQIGFAICWYRGYGIFPFLR
jgi:hypothetical protein